MMDTCVYSGSDLYMSRAMPKSAILAILVDDLDVRRQFLAAMSLEAIHHL